MAEELKQRSETKRGINDQKVSQRRQHEIGLDAWCRYVGYILKYAAAGFFTPMLLHA